jgi:hypothetical protein
MSVYLWVAIGHDFQRCSKTIVVQCSSPFHSSGRNQNTAQILLDTGIDTDDYLVIRKSFSVRLHSINHPLITVKARAAYYSLRRQAGNA